MLATIERTIKNTTPYGNGDTTRFKGRGRYKWQASTILAICFVASLVSPFLSYIGRGLTVTWSIFLIWLLLFTIENRISLSLYLSVFKKRRYALTMFLLWLFVVFFNASLERGYTGWNHFLLTITLGMIIFMQVVYSSLKPEAFKSIIFWTIILLGIEALRSLPMLFNNPGIARILMEIPDDIFLYDAYIAGTGDYNLYTANAIVLPCLIAIALDFNGIKRIILFTSCVFIGLAIFLSTFTAAVSMMVFGIFTLAVLSYGMSLKKFLKGLISVVLVILMFAMLYSFLGDTEQVNKVIEKNIRLYEGISTYGLLWGDETTRSQLFVISLDTFLANPLWGIGPCTTANNPDLYTYVGGHSSWIDQLAEYGILGFGTFIAFAMAVTMRVTRHLFQYRNSLVIKGAIISGSLYFIGGIVNPVIFITSIMTLFYLLVIGSADIAAQNEA